MIFQNNPVAYNLWTIWLFTKSDIKTVVLPQALFAVSSALTGGFSQSSIVPLELELFRSLGKAVLWVWLVLLVESIANQRLPNSIIEDANNKPWRPLPAQRLTPDQAKRILMALVPCVMITAVFLNAYKETTTLVVFVWMYNDLDGANSSIWIRNVLNAVGLMTFSTGTMAITTSSLQYPPADRAFLWIFLTGLVILTTIHAQDLPDMVGDAARGRKTIPLLYGHTVARWSLVAGVLAWSFICPAFWEMTVVGYVPTVVLGGLIVGLTTMCRYQSSDERVWKLWCLWIGTVYLLPVLKGLLPAA